MSGKRVRTNIGDLNRAVLDYHLLSGKSLDESLKKQGTKLVKEISFQLRNIASPGGRIRLAIMQRLRSGKFIKIRKSVVDSVTARWSDKLKARQERADLKSMWGADTQNNWKWRLQQQLVKREIGVRESGKGVLGFSAKYSRVENASKVLSKYGPLLSQVVIQVQTNSGELTLHWPGGKPLPEHVATALSDSKPAKAIADAIEVVRQDILVYVERKRLELAKTVVAGLVK